MSEKKSRKHHRCVGQKTCYCAQNRNCQFPWPSSVFIFDHAAYLVGSQGPGLAPAARIDFSKIYPAPSLSSDTPPGQSRFIALIRFINHQVERCKSNKNRWLDFFFDHLKELEAARTLPAAWNNEHMCAYTIHIVCIHIVCVYTLCVCILFVYTLCAYI